MLDYMEATLLRFYQALGWPHDEHYAALNAPSRALLGFQVPHGLAFTVGRAVAPQLHSSWTLAQPGAKHVGFLYSSVALPTAPLRLRDALAAPEMRVLDRVARATGAGPNPQPSGASLLYGRLFQDGQLEMLCAKQIGARAMGVISGRQGWGGTPRGTAQLVMSGRRATGEVAYATASQVLGLTAVASLPRADGRTVWSVGSELFYALRERSGGLSLGARYTTLHELAHGAPGFTELFVTANPMMGHLASAYTATITPRVLVSARYDLNVYSYESDVGVGCELRSRARETALEPPAGEHLVKVRLSPRAGIACMLEGEYERAVWSIGMSTGLGPVPRRRLGAELQVSLG